MRGRVRREDLEEKPYGGEYGIDTADIALRAFVENLQLEHGARPDVFQKFNGNPEEQKRQWNGTNAFIT